MSYNGGYKIVNLEGFSFTSGVGQTVKGIYENIENTNKPILVSGLEIDGVEIKDFFTLFSVSSTNFVGNSTLNFSGSTLTAYVITVTDEDLVTINNITVGESSSEDSGSET